MLVISAPLLSIRADLSQQEVQDIINAYEKDIEKFNKQKEILDKIKEYIKENVNANVDYILELLEEIKWMEKK